MPSTVCEVCFEIVDDAGMATHAFTNALHMREVQLESASPAYQAAKAAVIASGKAVLAAQGVAKKTGFFESMRQMTESLEKTREVMASHQSVFPSEAKDTKTCLNALGAEVGVRQFVEGFKQVEAAVSEERHRLTQLQISGENESDASTQAGDAAAKSPLETANKAYKTAQEQLDEVCTAVVASRGKEEDMSGVPHWRLKYFVETHSSADNKVEFEGGVITDAKGNVLWDVSCAMCGLQIQRGAFGEGTKRIVRLDADGPCAVCLDCWERWTCASSVFPAEAFTEAGWKFAVPSETFDVVEENEPTLMRVALLQRAGNHLGHLMDEACKVFGQRPCLGQLAADCSIRWVSYDEFRRQAESMADVLWDARESLMVDAPTPPPSFQAPSELSADSEGCSNFGRLPLVGITSENRTEFVVADVACLWSGCVSVGLHTTHTEDELVELVLHTGLRGVVLDAERWFTYLAVAARTDIEVLWCMDDAPPSLEPLRNRAGTEVRLVSLKTILREAPRSLKKFRAEEASTMNNGSLADSKPWGNGCSDSRWSDLQSIIFTSGSAGSPKGVLHTEPHFRYDVSHAVNVTPLVTVSYIPLSHSTDRMRLYETMLNGGHCCFVRYAHRNWESHELHQGSERFQLLREAAQLPQGDNGVGEMLTAIAAVRPTIFIAPPRVWKGLEHTAAAGGDRGVALLRGLFGGRVKSVATGGGPTDESTFKFVNDLFDSVPLLESYGATEAGAVAAGSAGAGARMPVAEGVLAIVRDPVFLPKSETEDNPTPLLARGELLVSTPTLTAGYWRNATASDAALTKVDGKWFWVSGDICECEVDGETATPVVKSCRVLGRVSNSLAIRTEDGTGTVKVFVESLEEAAALECESVNFSHSHFAVVPVAPGGYAIVVSAPYAEPPEEDYAELLHDGMKQRGYPTPTAVVLDNSTPWTSDPQNRYLGMLTVSLKVNRSAVALRFAKEIEERRLVKK